jgi:hypothetical protein
LGKAGVTDLLASGAPLALDLMFNDIGSLEGKINDLASLQAQRSLLLQIVLTMLARLHLMQQYLIGVGLQKERVAFMSGLPSRFLATALPQALGLADKAIGRWRKMAIATGFRQLVLQLLDLLLQERNHLTQRLIFLFEPLPIFFTSHTLILPDFLPSWQILDDLNGYNPFFVF